MEKLRQLLNDYEDYKEKETGYSNYDWRLNEINDEEEYEQWITAFRVDDSQLGVEESIAVIICKGYCFIEWLVENDKIDLENLQCVFSGNINKWKTLMEETDGYERYEGTEYGATESLLMLLAVQDEPIDFLISILK